MMTFVLRKMAFVLQDGGTHLHDDVVSGRCRGLAEKSDIRPAGRAEDVVFFPTI
jgi:hypothetical protein